MQRTAMPRPLVRLAGLMGLSAVLVVTGTLPASAGAPLSATAPTTAVVAEGTTTRLEGMRVAGGGAPTLAVTVATSTGSVQVDTTTGIALAYGNSATGASVSFSGTPAAVNAALAGTDLVAPAGSAGQTAAITVTAYPQRTGMVYGSATGHFYEYVPAEGVDWFTARDQAAARRFLDATGYLVTITSAEENALVTSRIENAQNIWIGAEAVATESYPRAWRWAVGPEAGQVFDTCTVPTDVCDFATRPGYSNWADGEPNNYAGTTGVDGESVAVTNWNGTSGLWNDLGPGASDPLGYVVEYGDGSPFADVAVASSTVVIGGAPGAPTGVTAVAGTEQATVSFTAPTSDGGSAITSYLVSASPAGPTATCGASPCVVTGLTASQPYTFTVRATSAFGTGEPSAPSDPVTPGAPSPPPVGTPTARAGTSSVVVSWTASTAPDVTGYTVTATVGAATCHVGAGTTRCVLGAVAGQAVSFRVVTHSRWGDSAPSAWSPPVVPLAPAVPAAPPSSAPPTLTTSEGPLTSVQPGRVITLIGSGFAPFSSATVVVYSEPRVLGTAVTDAAGAFRLTVTVPGDLPPGDHTFVALGTDPTGEVYAMRLPVAVPAPAQAVAATGAETGPLALASLALVLCGATLLRLASRLAPRRA